MANITSTDVKLNNTSEFEDDQLTLGFIITRAVVFGVLSIFTIIINCFSFVVFQRVDKMNEVTRLLVMSLTVTDITFGLFGLLPHSILTIYGEKPELNEFCIVVWGITTTLPYFDLLFLLLINGERYIACTRPLRYATIVTRKRVIKVIYGVAIVGCVQAVVFLIFIFKGNKDIFFNKRYGTCSIYNGFSSKEELILLTLIAVFTSFCPIVMVMYMISRLLYIAKQHKEQEIQLQAVSHAPSINTHKSSFNRKGVFTFLLITLSVVFVWTPITVVFIYDEISANEISAYVIFCSYVLVYSSAWINVIIYYMRNREFRMTAKRLLKLQ